MVQTGGNSDRSAPASATISKGQNKLASVLSGTLVKLSYAFTNCSTVHYARQAAASVVACVCTGWPYGITACLLCRLLLWCCCERVCPAA